MTTMIKKFAQFTEELKKVEGTQKGSNDGGIHINTETGEKHYVKHYHNADQAKTEALVGKIYHHMGIHTIHPQYIEHEGKPAISTKWNEHLKPMHKSEFDNLSHHQAHQVARMKHAAVLTKNWDIVGLQHDNIMKDHKGNLTSIDHGGSMNFRAQGGHKDYGHDIGEHKSLIDNHEASGHVFKSTFKQHPDVERKGLDAVKNIDDTHIHHLFKHSGLSNWKELHSSFVSRKKKLLDHYKESEEK